MLPTPSIDYIPKLNRENVDVGWTALTNKIDSLLGTWGNDVKNIFDILDPARCPAILLQELNYLLSAGFREEDTDAQKRQKIYNAIATHKIRGTWTTDAKIRIDTITGYDATIFRAIDSDDWIWLAKETTDPDYYWATWQPKDGSDDDLGCWLVRLADPVAYVVAGYISIDCHQGVNVQTLTEATIDKIHDELVDDVVPAYMIIRLGYVNATGQFIVYPFTKATI